MKNVEKSYFLRKIKLFYKIFFEDSKIIQKKISSDSLGMMKKRGV